MTSMLDLKQSSPEKSSHEFILVVEDDAAISELLAICIEEETSYHTLSVTSGEETLRRIEELKETRPLLFILDLLLPIGDEREGLIEQHQLLSRIYRQKTGDDETEVVGKLGARAENRGHLPEPAVRCRRKIIKSRTAASTKTTAAS